MDPLASGGGAISHVSKDSYYLRPKGIQYELGTPPVSQAIGFAAAVRYLQDLGMDDVARHAAILTRYAAQGLARIPGVRVVGDHSSADGQKGIVAFTVAGAAPAQVSGFLGKLGVAIRAGGHCALPLHASLGLIGTARISMGVYTTLDDVDAALVAVQTFAKLLK
jgi:cysteine desulfurase/selenocysteine lyase